jgi:exodeoxyribonuclease V alpha subunit
MPDFNLDFDDDAEPLPEDKTLRGTVTRIFYSSAGFSAGKLRPAGKHGEVSFAGKVFVDKVGEVVHLRGKWKNDPKWGRQFAVESLVYDEALDAAGLAAWLESTAKGIGHVRALRVAEQFGSDFAAALRDIPDEVARIAQVPLEVITRLASEWALRDEYNVLATKLAAWGLTEHQIRTLYDQFQGSTVKVLEADPYQITRYVTGFGFRKADEIAQKIGVSKSHPGRLAAGIVHAVEEGLDSGHTCLSQSGLTDAAGKLLALDDLGAAATILSHAHSLVQEGKRLAEPVPQLYALPFIAGQERAVANFLRSARDYNPHFRMPAKALDELVSRKCENIDGKRLDESQQRAVRTALANRVTVISGGAGSGKSTICNAITRIYRQAGKSVVLCAPTGKAARRLEEIINLDASTIHRLLGYNPALGFTVQCGMLKADVVVLDEVSMVDIPLAYHLLDALSPKTCLVMVGDHHQLPPVGPGALLRDCIASDFVPMSVLGHCHRQAGPLKQNCADILQGRIADTVMTDDPDEAGPWYVHRKLNSPDEILACCERLFTTVVERWGYDPLRDVQFLSPMHKGPIGTRAVNGLLQRLHQKTLDNQLEPVDSDKPLPLHKGDKVICTRNNYDLEVMNGTLGLVLSVKPNLVVRFDGVGERTVPNDCRGDVQLAYCLSVHKTQGSEFPCVVTVCARQHSYMWHRGMIYTAATRARKTACIIGDDWTIKNAAQRVESDLRRTLLPVFLRSEEEAAPVQADATPPEIPDDFSSDDSEDIPF